MRMIDGAREYAKFTPTPATSDPWEVSFDDGATWLPLEPGTVDADGAWSASPTGTVHAILVATPSATGSPTGTVVVPLGRTSTRVRRVDTTEVIVLETDPIDVYP